MKQNAGTRLCAIRTHSLNFAPFSGNGVRRILAMSSLTATMRCTPIQLASAERPKRQPPSSVFKVRSWPAILFN